MLTRYTSPDGSALPLWQQVYNMVDSKVARLSLQAYDAANTGRKRHVPYTIPAEAEDMVQMLGELGPDTSTERCQEIAGYATSPAINQAIYGGT
jgi:hypothetical protein